MKLIEFPQKDTHVYFGVLVSLSQLKVGITSEVAERKRKHRKVWGTCLWPFVHSTESLRLLSIDGKPVDAPSLEAYVKSVLAPTAVSHSDELFVPSVFAWNLVRDISYMLHWSDSMFCNVLYGQYLNATTSGVQYKAQRTPYQLCTDLRKSCVMAARADEKLRSAFLVIHPSSWVPLSEFNPGLPPIAYHEKWYRRMLKTVRSEESTDCSAQAAFQW